MVQAVNLAAHFLNIRIDDEHQRKDTMIAAKKALIGKPIEQIVMVFCPEFQPQVTTLSANEGVFMFALLSGKSLA
jgi:hypothetical protein